MVPAALRRSLAAKSVEDVLKSIPKQFTLNAGHVKFFYDKQLFLVHRFNLLCKEMLERGYSPDYTRILAFNDLPQEFYGLWRATEQDNDLVRERIALRISQKPHLYKD